MKRSPRAALGAAAKPLGGDEATLGAGVDGTNLFCHALTLSKNEKETAPLAKVAARDSKIRENFGSWGGFCKEKAYLFSA
ncbi:hypothetical protein [Corynebacterium aurimucosum]|uniref:hypothetical protein n=1 Tax=Corynebacterium aurimucosum TaxID=169292 RepID=UPI0035B55414